MHQNTTHHPPADDVSSPNKTQPLPLIYSTKTLPSVSFLWITFPVSTANDVIMHSKPAFAKGYRCCTLSPPLSHIHIIQRDTHTHTYFCLRYGNVEVSWSQTKWKRNQNYYPEHVIMWWCVKCTCLQCVCTCLTSQWDHTLYQGTAPKTAQWVRRELETGWKRVVEGGLIQVQTVAQRGNKFWAKSQLVCLSRSDSWRACRFCLSICLYGVVECTDLCIGWSLSSRSTNWASNWIGV